MSRREIEDIVNKLLLAKGAFSSGELGREARISRQGVNRHLQVLVAEGRLVAEGKGRGVRYRGPRSTFRRVFRREALREDEVWAEILRALPELDDRDVARARTVLAYAFTEMLNNAIDHSASTDVEVSFEIADGTARFSVTDQGVGVYENVRARLGLPDATAALQELSKGKVTTQPAAHTGQGIFFTSKMADLFDLQANGLSWVVDNRRGDVAVSDVPASPGTAVRVELSLATTVDPAEVFARYSHGEDFEFDTSRVVIKLFERGVEFVSRSEAKRVVTGLDRFKHVVLDFQGVKSVGQGFVDEIFRVWGAAHPAITLEPVSMQPAVARMVAAGRAHGGAPARATSLADAPPAPELLAAGELPAGWSDASIRRVLADPDAVTELSDLGEEGGKIAVATRRNVRRGDWTFVAIVVTRTGGGRRTLVDALALPRQETSDVLWASPTDALRRFMASYGQAVTIGQSRSTEGADLLTIGYAIDRERHREALARAGIHIDVP